MCYSIYGHFDRPKTVGAMGNRSVRISPTEEKSYIGLYSSLSFREVFYAEACEETYR